MKMIDPKKRLKRDPKDGILFSIKTEQEDIRRIWEFPNEHQDHICKIFGYCRVHKTDHSHPKRPKKAR